MSRPRWYVAVQEGRTPQGRRNWRLYSVPGDGRQPRAHDALGDFDRLRKVRGILERPGRRVEVHRSARRQVAFWVGKA